MCWQANCRRLIRPFRYFSAYYENTAKSGFDPGSAVAADALARFKQARTIHGLGLQIVFDGIYGVSLDELIPFH